MATQKRIMKEYNEIQKTKQQGFTDVILQPDENNIYLWYAKCLGPKGTSYEDGVFELKIQVSKEYPITPPKVEFLTKIFHPNVHFETGEICMDILKDKWSPVWTLLNVCRAIMSMLSNPREGSDSPLNCDAGNLLRNNDERGFNSMAKMYTKLYALESNLVHYYH
ncbi:hypothetical protein C9374_002050 [Naegleria lovaniensis]|uniref:UBC core domain-containing protein n=1 Tax=Naegleria lovaniensis TaxID=51637 RepID=A0AA88GU94_NAELO|nr:Peroxin 4 (Pex4), putative [Naegleria lovaniensis]KAG2387015.1 hypothetical protein C9374_002050 [Naegleria lovaniensis]